MPPYIITIHVVPKPGGRWEIKVTPDRQTAKWREEIKWTCRLPFVVYFGKYGPMSRQSFGHGNPQGSVRYNAALMGRRVFKYIVGVLYRNEIKIIDPDLEIVP